VEVKPRAPRPEPQASRLEPPCKFPVSPFYEYRCLNAVTNGDRPIAAALE
jgi:hypothetical protein